MSALVARLGDPNSHGGAILAGSPTVLCNALPVARINDPVSCPIHGNNVIVSGSVKTFANGLGVAMVGSLCACGATITAGSPDTVTG